MATQSASARMGSWSMSGLIIVDTDILIDAARQTAEPCSPVDDHAVVSGAPAKSSATGTVIGNVCADRVSAAPTSSVNV